MIFIIDNNRFYRLVVAALVISEAGHAVFVVFNHPLLRSCVICCCAFTPDATCANKLCYSRVVGGLNILSLLASFARDIHVMGGASARRLQSGCQMANMTYYVCKIRRISSICRL